jgi:hypothetical protein
MRYRGNISPHTLYYSQPPSYSYSSILVKAYLTAKNEFGLRLAKKVLTQVGLHLPNELAMQQQIEDLISVDSHLWDICAEEDTLPVDSEEMLFASVRNILQEDFGIEMEPTPSLALYEEETSCKRISLKSIT